MKKFTEGLVFGGGFAISFITIWYIAAYFITPLFVSNQIKTISSYQQPETSNTEKSLISLHTETKPFHELELNEQIKLSSVIALAKYEKSPDGKNKAIIKEFLKKAPGTEIYYEVGDEYESSSYYPRENSDYGDGTIIFFVGSPAQMRLSMSYSGDRIRGLGDLPIKLLRKKCNDTIL